MTFSKFDYLHNESFYFLKNGELYSLDIKNLSLEHYGKLNYLDKGNIIFPDTYMMLLAEDLLRKKSKGILIQKYKYHNVSKRFMIDEKEFEKLKWNIWHINNLDELTQIMQRKNIGIVGDRIFAFSKSWMESLLRLSLSIIRIVVRARII